MTFRLPRARALALLALFAAPALTGCLSSGPNKVQQMGNAMVGMTQGGQGVASMPIYQSQPTGYYQQQETVDYLCSIIVSTNAQNIIKEVTVAGCD